MAIASSGAIGAVINVLDGGLIPDITSDQLGIGPMPGPEGNPLTLVGGGSLYIVAEKGDAAAAAAWDYIQYLIEAQTQSIGRRRRATCRCARTPSTSIRSRSTYATDPRFKVAYDSIKAAPPDDPSALGPVLGPMREVRAVTAIATASIFGGADVASTLAAAAQQADALIADYNARN